MNDGIYGYVYMIKNKINNKIYFGITRHNFNARYKGDIVNTHNEHLKYSIEKYGIENFEINEEFDVAYNENDLYDLEDMYICIYNTIDDKYGYNKRRSGKEHKGSGLRSEESKQKQGEARKGKYSGENSAWYGKKHTEEAKTKISNALKGNTYNTGKTLSEEHKDKIRKSTIGKKHSNEAKIKMSRSRGGKRILCVEANKIFDTAIEASEWCNGDDSCILKCCRGKRDTHKKYHWEFVE